MRYFSIFPAALVIIALFHGCSKSTNGRVLVPLKPVLYEYDMDNLEFHSGFHQAEARGIGEIGDNLARSGYYTLSEKVDDVELRV